VSRILSLGHRLSRDVFLCLGGASLLIAIGGAAGNLPDILKYRDWPTSEVSQLYSTISLFAIFGTVFLAVAFVLFRSKRWGTYLAAAVSASALLWMAIAWSSETIDRAGFAIVLSFPAVPLLLTLIWAIVEAARDLKQRRRAASAGIQRNQIA